MTLQLARTSAGQELSRAEIGLLGDLASRHGRATLVTSSMPMADLHRRALARGGVGLGVDVCTPVQLIERLWGIAGDGRRLVGRDMRAMLVDALMRRAEPCELAPMRFNRGTAVLVGRAARDMLPWARRSVRRFVREAEAGSLGPADRRLCALLEGYADDLGRRGLIEPCEAALLLADAMGEGSCPAPALAIRDASEFPEYLCALVEAAAGRSAVTVLLDPARLPLAGELRRRFSGLAPRLVALEPDKPASAVAAGAERLFWGVGRSAAASASAGDEPASPAPSSVPAPWLSFAEAAGPSARVAAYAEAIAASRPPSGVVVASPDPLGDLEPLASRLERSDVSVLASGSVPFSKTQAGRVFFALADLTRRMREGAVSSWWPAPELADWLMSPLSGVTLAQARDFDKRLRGKRHLDAEGVLRALQGLQAQRRNALRDQGTEDADDAVVAFDVVHALVRGRYAEALRRLGASARAAAGFSPLASSVERDAVDLACSFIAAALDDRVDPESAVAVLGDQPVPVRATASRRRPEEDPGPSSPSVRVELMTLDRAAALPAASVGSLVALDVDAETYSVAVHERPDDALAEKLGCAGVALDAAGVLRDRFYRASCAAREGVVLARVAHDAQGDVRYPAVVWTELMSRADGANVVAGLPDENHVAGNLAARAPGRELAHAPAPSLSATSLPCLLPLVRTGSGGLAPRRFSASQIENYLNCPYQWFLSSRISPRDIDARFSGLEQGNLVHDVMQRFHEGLAAGPHGRVRPSNVDESLDLLREVFRTVRDEHARGRTATSAPLVPQTPSEALEADAILLDLERAVRFEADLLPPFEPRYAEYAFDKLDVTYAGVPLGGRIDRIDVDPNGRAVVIDYKHRGSLSEFGVKDPTGQGDGELDPAWLPRHVQALVYAQAVRRALDLDVRGALYFGTRGPAVAGAVADELVDMVPGMREGFPGKGGHLAFADLLDLTEERVARALDDLARGRIEPSESAQSCRFCPAFACPLRKE